MTMTIVAGRFKLISATRRSLFVMDQALEDLSRIDDKTLTVMRRFEAEINEPLMRLLNKLADCLDPRPFSGPNRATPASVATARREFDDSYLRARRAIYYSGPETASVLTADTLLFLNTIVSGTSGPC